MPATLKEAPPAFLLLYDAVSEGTDDYAKEKAMEVLQISFARALYKNPNVSFIPVKKETEVNELINEIAARLQEHGAVVVADMMCVTIHEKGILHDFGETSVMNYVRQNSATFPCGHWAILHKDAILYLFPVWHNYTALRVGSAVQALDLLVRVAADAKDITMELPAYGNEETPKVPPVYARWNGPAASSLNQYKLYLDSFSIIRLGDKPTSNTVEIGMNLFRRYNLLYTTAQRPSWNQHL